jgi:hypothetical protein
MEGEEEVQDDQNNNNKPAKHGVYCAYGVQHSWQIHFVSYSQSICFAFLWK